jgi:hypothetical protein
VSYLHWLVATSLAFVVAERLFAWRKSSPPAAGLWRDLASA